MQCITDGMGHGKRMAINWAKYFDRIYCLFYCPYMDIKNRLEKELLRVRILDSGIFEYCFTSPTRYDQIVQDSFEDKTHILREGWINESLALERIMRQSLALGYERILVLEDDCIFLRDLEEVKRIFDSAPLAEYDFIQYDSGLVPENTDMYFDLVNSKKINMYFSDSSEVWFGMATCNSFNRNGMQLVIDQIEKKPVVVDQLANYIKFKSAITIKRPCIQIFDSKCQTGDGEWCHWPYWRAGVNYWDYNLPDAYCEANCKWIQAKTDKQKMAFA